MHHGTDSALGILVAALLFDGVLGEYPRAIHPVVWLGKLITGLMTRAPRSGWLRQLLFGLLLVLVVTVLSVATAALSMYLAAGIPVLELVAGTFLLKASFALRELGEAAARVEKPLQRGDLAAARAALRSLCSRDPADLEGAELREATIESLAENVSDSVVAPLLFYLCFGVAGAVGYRAINTLDAMIGYRGEYEYLGKAAARLDDLVNWVPARLTALLLLLVGWAWGKNVAGGWRILRRDGANTPSPNGGRPMAVMAGLLGIRLTKKGVYVLGDAVQPVTSESVGDARRLTTSVGFAMVGLCALGILGMRRVLF